MLRDVMRVGRESPARAAPGTHLVGIGALEGGLVGVEVLELQHAHLAQRRNCVVRSLRRDHQLHSFV